MKDEALKLALEALQIVDNVALIGSAYTPKSVEEGLAKVRASMLVIKQALAAPVQDLPFGVGGGLVAIKTLLSRDPCIHANTAIEMIDAILKEHSAAQPAPVPLTDDVVQKIISKLEPLLDAKNQSWAEAERMLHGITKGQP
jgi:hypothetical protein